MKNINRVLVACSGGPDSMALLEVMDQWARREKVFLAVGHVDHGLRGAASRADAVFVQKECRRRGLPVAVERVAVRWWARRAGRGIEEAARHLRYRALARMARRWRCPVVVTAHTIDDQVETVIMRLLRGAGPTGLGAMAEVAVWPVEETPRGAFRPVLYRPLLGVRKAVLLKFLRERRLPWRRDATNADPAFLRNRLRPTLRAWDRDRPGLFERVARTAGLLRDEEDYWRRRLPVRRKHFLRRLERASFLRYHVAEQRRRLRRCFGLGGADAVERVRAFAANGAMGSIDIPGARVSKTRRFLTFHRHLKKAVL